MADQHEPTTEPSESPPAPRTPGARRRYRRRLGNLQNVKVGLADVIRDLEEGTRDAGTCRALVYGYSTLATVIDLATQSQDIAERLSALEARLAQAPSPANRVPFRPSILAGSAGA